MIHASIDSLAAPLSKNALQKDIDWSRCAHFPVAGGAADGAQHSVSSFEYALAIRERETTRSHAQLHLKGHLTWVSFCSLIGNCGEGNSNVKIHDVMDIFV